MLAEVSGLAQMKVAQPKGITRFPQDRPIREQPKGLPGTIDQQTIQCVGTQSRHPSSMPNRIPGSQSPSPYAKCSPKLVVTDFI